MQNYILLGWRSTKRDFDNPCYRFSICCVFCYVKNIVVSCTSPCGILKPYVPIIILYVCLITIHNTGEDEIVIRIAVWGKCEGEFVLKCRECGSRTGCVFRVIILSGSHTIIISVGLLETFYVDIGDSFKRYLFAAYIFVTPYVKSIPPQFVIVIPSRTGKKRA